MKPLLNQLTKRQPPRNVSHDEPESALLPSLPYSPSSAWPRQGIEHDSTTLRTAASAPHHKTRFDTQELQIPSPSHDSQDSSSWHRHRSWSDESDARIARVVLSPLMKASPDMSSLQAASWTDVSSSSIEVPSSPGVRAQQRIRFEHSTDCEQAVFDLPFTPRAAARDAADASGSALLPPRTRIHSSEKPSLSHSPSTTVTTSGPVTPNFSGAALGDELEFEAQSPALSVASILKSQQDAMAALAARWQNVDEARAKDKATIELAEVTQRSVPRLHRDLSTIAESETGSSYSTAREQHSRSGSTVSSSHTSSCPSDSEYDEADNIVIHHAVRQPPPVWTRAVPSPKVIKPSLAVVTGIAPGPRAPPRLQPLSSSGDDTLRDGSSSDADGTWACIKKLSKTRLASEDSVASNEAGSSFDLSFTRKYGHTSKSQSLSSTTRATRAAHREAFQLHSRKPGLVSDEVLRKTLEHEEQSASEDERAASARLTSSRSDTYGLGLDLLSSDDSTGFLPFDIEGTSSSGLMPAHAESYGRSSPLRPPASSFVAESPITARIEALLTEIRHIGSPASASMVSSSSAPTLSLKQRRHVNPKSHLRIVATSRSDARLSTRLRSPAASSPRDSLCLVSPHLVKSSSSHSLRIRAQKESSAREKQVIVTPPPLPTPTPRSVASAAKAQRILGIKNTEHSPYGPRVAQVVADFEAQTAASTARPSVAAADASVKSTLPRAKKRRGLLRRAKSMSAIEEPVPTETPVDSEDAL